MTRNITIALSNGKEVLLTMNDEDWAPVKKKLESILTTSVEVLVDRQSGEFVHIYPAQICYIRVRKA